MTEALGSGEAATAVIGQPADEKDMSFGDDPTIRPGTRAPKLDVPPSQADASLSTG